MKVTITLKDGGRAAVQATRKVGDEVLSQVRFCDANQADLHAVVHDMAKMMREAVKIDRPARIISDKLTTGGV
jgi:hypothetical protein